jgi:hypothetical protein
MDIGYDSKAQRFYRSEGGQLVDYRGVSMDEGGEQNDPRNFASLLRVKVCFTNIVCECGEKMEDYEDEHEQLFYRDGLGTYIQWTDADGTRRGMREAVSTFQPSNPPCNVGSELVAHIRANTLPGGGEQVSGVGP